MATNGKSGWDGGYAKYTPYEAWVRQQGVPIVEGYGITDLGEQEFGFWERLGCRAYFVLLKGMEGISGMYVAEIPAGGTTHPERHLYEKIIYVLQGNGATTVQDHSGQWHQFEWQQGSLFAIPLNATHRLFAAGQDARYVAFTTAPLVFDLFHTEDFVYNTPYDFRDRYDGGPSFFQVDERHEARGSTLMGSYVRRFWETNFVPDLGAVMPVPVDGQGQTLRYVQLELASNTQITHLSKYPIGRYMQGHFHAGGAILLILRSEGYSLMWSSDLGERPFEAGHGDKVVRVDWKPGSVFSPPTGWYHQHFNAGPHEALQLALRHGSARFPSGLWIASTRRGDTEAVVTASSEGGTMIEYEREDPAIRRLYAEALARSGVESAWLRERLPT
jgi:quercetin dioxygenase-like cupin family protein